jgi:hypothetical protein
VHDNEQLKEVAVAMGWTDLGTEIKRGWVGRPPDRLGYHPVPNWFKDLSACMAKGGPWEWLIKQGYRPTLYTSQSERGYETLSRIKQAATLHIHAGSGDDSLKACAQAICHAVLAVVEKLEEQENG